MSPAAAASLKDICYSLVSAKVGVVRVSLVVSVNAVGVYLDPAGLCTTCTALRNHSWTYSMCSRPGVMISEHLHCVLVPAGHDPSPVAVDD